MGITTKKKQRGESMKFKEWDKLRNLILELDDEVNKRLCAVEVSKAFDNVWDFVDELRIEEEEA